MKNFDHRPLKLNFLKFLSLLLFFLLFACQKDDAVVNHHEDRDRSVATVSQEEVLDYLNSKNPDGLKRKSSGLDLVLDLSQSQHEPLTNTDQELLVVPAHTRYKAESTRAVFLRLNGTIEPLLVYMFRNKDAEGEHFSGRIVILELDGKFKRGFRVENGVFTHKLVSASAKYQKRGMSGGCAEHMQNQSDCYFCTQHLGVVIIEAPIDPFVTFRLRLYGGFDASGSNDRDSDPGMGWGYGGGGGGAGYDDGEEENDSEDRIDTEDLDNDCVEGIIKGLQEKDGHLSVIPDLGIEVSHLSQIILDLFDKSQEFHLKFQIGDASFEGVIANAKTDSEPSNPFTGEFTFIITLDEDFVKNATQLAIARTIIHEAMHAYLGHMYQDNPFATFSQLLRTYFHDKGMSTAQGQHLLMTQFAKAIGASLASWDGHVLSSEYYNAMGWSGDMLNTDAFDKLDQDFKDLILQSQKNEGSAIAEATENAKGNTNCQ